MMGAHTGAMGLRSVSSKTFSIADFDGSTGGGLTSVGWSAMVLAVVELGKFWRYRP